MFNKKIFAYVSNILCTPQQLTTMYTKCSRFLRKFTNSTKRYNGIAMNKMPFQHGHLNLYIIKVLIKCVKLRNWTKYPQFLLQWDLSNSGPLEVWSRGVSGLEWSQM